MIDRFNKISSVLLLTIVAECMSKPLDSQTLSTLPSQMTKVHGNRMKRSPLELGYVASGLSPHNDEQHFSSDISSHDHIRKFTPSFPLQVQEAISTNAIKSETLHKGPFVSDGAVINLVGHEIHQIHDTSQHHEFPRQIIVPLNDHPVIIPHTITVIHGLTPPISKPKKASGVSHLFASENKFETHANVNSLDNESDFSEHFVPVIPVTSHIVLGHVAKPTSTQPQHGPLDLNEFGDQPIALPQRDEGNYRSMVGGYGVGLGSGGQGAGHGFYSSAFK